MLLIAGEGNNRVLGRNNRVVDTDDERCISRAGIVCQGKLAKAGEVISGLPCKAMVEKLCVSLRNRLEFSLYIAFYEPLRRRCDV